MAIEIRPAEIAHLGAVQDLNSASFQNDAANDDRLVMTWPYDRDTGEAFFRARIKGDGVCLVALDGAGVVGYLAGALRDNETYRRGRRTELENMFVKDSGRRQGIGTALLEAFMAWSRNNGADENFVSAYFGNQQAVAFYQHNGFLSYAHDLVMKVPE